MLQPARAANDCWQVAEQEEIELLCRNGFVERRTSTTEVGPLDLDVLIGAEFLFDELSGPRIGRGIPLQILPVVKASSWVAEADGQSLG